MYKKAEKHTPIKKENMEIERISEVEKQNIRGISEAAHLERRHFLYLLALDWVQ